MGHKVDFRWLERDVQNIHPATNVYSGRPRETVLQFRECLPELPGGWTAWQDVQKVSEPTKPIYARGEAFTSVWP